MAVKLDTLTHHKYLKYKKKYLSIKKTGIKYDLDNGARVIYFKKYITNTKKLFEELRTSIPWKQFDYVVHGRTVKSPRLMNIIDLTKNSELPNFKLVTKKIEKLTNKQFSYAVLNFYRDGNDYVGYHADRETNGIVVSVSLGATRRFILRHKIKENQKHTFLLEDGDVLVLNEAAIKGVYKHSVPKMANVGPRISITFRE